MVEIKEFVSEETYAKVKENVEKMGPPDFFFSEEDIDKYVLPDLKGNFPFLCWLSTYPAKTKKEKECNDYAKVIIDLCLIKEADA